MDLIFHRHHHINHRAFIGDHLRSLAYRDSWMSRFPFPFAFDDAIDSTDPNGFVAVSIAEGRPNRQPFKRQLAFAQDMLDPSADHGVASDIEINRIQNINRAYERLLKGDIKCRFAIDMAS